MVSPWVSLDFFMGFLSSLVLDFVLGFRFGLLWTWFSLVLGFFGRLYGFLSVLVSLDFVLGFGLGFFRHDLSGFPWFWVSLGIFWTWSLATAD